jgi:HAD superfamily hydrolase (TIGR01509 family)
MMARALVLDFGGVVTKTLFETHAQSELALGLAPGTLDWLGPFDPSTDSDWVAMQAGEMTEREYWVRRAREVGRLVGEDWSEMTQLLRATRLSDPMRAIRTEALDAIATAEAHGCKLGILSNELDLFYGPEFREALPFLSRFDAIVDATYTGVLKPDPAAFLRVADELGVEPDDCVFVDDQARNLPGAEEVRMVPVLLDVRDPASGFASALRHLGISTAPPATEQMMARRERVLGANVSTMYDDPVHLVRGDGVWVWGADGRRYLDCYNNVPHVGHCHPRVVEAIARQSATLNTHTRYLHEGILDYVERLTATFADHLSTAIMVCTGSEANDIALRIAEAATGRRGVITTDHTYHGNTTAVASLSSSNAPRTGTTSHVRHVPAPDSYRPLGGVGGEGHARAFTVEVARAVDELSAGEHGFAALLVCPFFANEGFPTLDAGFLDGAVEVVRRAGGVLIADEVQPGFGRLGSHMWGHQRMGVAPDVVTLGKPMGNGHPVAAVVTSPELMAAFRSSFRYFNTFGGNPVSCAAANAVLDVLRDEALMESADRVGAYARQQLSALAQRHEVIGDVRGAGLFFGAELVSDRATQAPATAYTEVVVNEMRRRGILLNKVGINYNTLKIRPNLQFRTDHVDLLIETLDTVLSDTPIVT